uniref:Ergosterol biosynthesis 28 homolog n=1 Tax=Canis lupus familiaris TaxID=9615 RepID=A0A8P0TL20_CANLF
MSRFLNVLRSWLVMVSIIAIGNTLQSFRDHTFLYEKLYTGKPDLVNGLQARTFGIWTLLSSVIRCLCAIDIHNKTYAVPHHTLDLPPRPGALPLRAVCLWDCSSHDWRPGTPDGGNCCITQSSCHQGLLQEVTLPGWAPLCYWTQDSEPSEEQAILRRAPLIEVKGEDMVPPFSSSLSQHQLPQPIRGRGRVSSVHLVKGAILPK